MQRGTCTSSLLSPLAAAVDARDVGRARVEYREMRVTRLSVYARARSNCSAQESKTAAQRARIPIGDKWLLCARARALCSSSSSRVILIILAPG